jgi:predicted dehydrogenase
MSEKIRIGIIGTGFAKTVQIPAFQKIAEAEIVSVASAHLENAEKVAKDFEIPHWTDNWRETIERKDVDLIVITTPPKLHREMTLYALEHEKHILCEKPMAMNAVEALEMWKKSKEKNVMTLIDHELRFQTGRQKAFEMIRSGEIGKIRHANYNFRAPNRGEPHLPWNWWHDISQGGGNLGASISHIFDTFRWFLDTEISSVFCQLQTQVKQRRDEQTGEMRDVTTDDQVNALLRLHDSEFTEDMTANISASMVEYPKYQNRVEFFGTKGAIRIEHRGEIFIGRAGENDWKLVETDLGEMVEGAPDTGFSRGFIVFAKEIITALKNGKTNIEHAATFEDGYKIQLALDAARESDKQGCVVKLKSD